MQRAAFCRNYKRRHNLFNSPVVISIPKKLQAALLPAPIVERVCSQLCAVLLWRPSDFWLGISINHRCLSDTFSGLVLFSPFLGCMLCKKASLNKRPLRIDFWEQMLIDTEEWSAVNGLNNSACWSLFRSPGCRLEIQSFFLRSQTFRCLHFSALLFFIPKKKGPKKNLRKALTTETFYFFGGS